MKGSSFSIMERLGSFYTRQSAKLAAHIDKSQTFQYLAKKTNQDPKKLTLGFVEGSLMYKLTFPITAPICLYAAVRGRRYYLGKNAIEGGKSTQELLEECSDMVDEDSESDNDN